MGRIRLQQADPIDGRLERGRGDLPMYRTGTVAEFRCADDQFKAAIVTKRDFGVGDMTVRRHGVDHGQCDALADQPVVGEFDFRPLGPHRAFDQVEALIEPVAAVEYVGVLGAGRRQHRIARFDHVAAADFIWADADALGQFVDGGFHGEQCLRQAVTPECTRRHRIGVGDDGIDPLVRTIIDGDRLAAGMKQHRAGMIAICASIREHVEVQCRQFSVPVGGRLHGDPHRVSCGGRGELFLARELELDRTSGLDGGQRQNVLDEHLLLAPEAAADAFAKHPDLIRRKVKNIRQRKSCQERRLGAATDVESTVAISPCDAAVGLQGGMLDALGRKRSLVGDGGAGESGGDVAVLTVGFRHDVALRVCNPLFPCLVAVNRGRAQ